MRVAIVICVLTSLVWLKPASAEAFNPGCALPSPLNQIQQHRQIDDICGIDGSNPGQPHILQNQHKNDFCVPGPTVNITRDVFVRLQAAAEKTGIKFGRRDDLPPDRSPLRNLIKQNGISLGEGTLVRYVAVISEARHSNLSHGESVNCDKHGPSKNDIHIDLSRGTDEDPCESITAEISPHFRPDSWYRLAGTGSVHKREQPLADHPVRVSGPLFFDASHVPCTLDPNASPPRASIWEIHPVYSIDVCSETSLAVCVIDDDSLWTPLHEFEP